MPARAWQNISAARRQKIHSLAACGAAPEERVATALDTLALDPDADIAHRLFDGLDLVLPHLPRGSIRELPPRSHHPPALRPSRSRLSPALLVIPPAP